MQVIESSTGYFGHVYGHSKLIIEPRTQIPHNRSFAYIAILINVLPLEVILAGNRIATSVL